MAAASAPSKASSIREPRSLRGQTLLGLAWMVSQSLGTKLVSLVGQLVLAYLLLPEHFAAISLAYTVTAFARVLENGGLREVLVHRTADFDHWLNPAFWLSLTLGLGSSLTIVAVAPLAAWLYQSSEVQSLLFCLAVSPLIIALGTVPTAKLQNQHRFHVLAGIAALQGLSQVAATVGFAWLGWGAYSFAFGSLVSCLLNTVLAWYSSSPTIHFKFDFEKWGALWSDTLSLSLVTLTTTLIQQVDYMMLGIFHTKLEVGYYFFAYGLATQTTQILSSNIATVFLPILCKIQADFQRQLRVSIQSLQTLAALGIPLSFLQCGVTSAGFQLFLPVKWLPAVPYAQVLSLGLGLNLLSSLCWCLLKSQGRFRTILVLNTLGAIGFTFLIFISAAYGTPLLVAWCVVLFCAIYSPLVCWLSIVRIGGTWQHVASIFAVPILASIVALTIAGQIKLLVPLSSWQLHGRILAVTLAFGLVYGAIMSLTRPRLFAEIVQLARHRQGKRSDATSD